MWQMHFHQIKANLAEIQPENNQLKISNKHIFDKTLQESVVVFSQKFPLCFQEKKTSKETLLASCVLLYLKKE